LTIWAGFVSGVATIPAQIDQWDDSRPVRAARDRLAHAFTTYRELPRMW
jgi:hypothetical protein